MGDVLHPSNHLDVPALDSLQQVKVLPVVGTPELGTVLQVGSHQSSVERQNHFPQPPCHSFEATQNIAGVLGCSILQYSELSIFQ